MEKLKAKLLNWEELIIPWLLTHGIKILIIITGAIILNYIGKKIIERAVRIAVVADNYSSRESELKREETLIFIFRISLRIVIMVLAALMILQEAGLQIGPILAAAGIIGIAFGFGGQYLIRDLISGLFIILENQYRIGDVVNLDGTGGLVEKISLRMTTLRDLDGTVHHIPNGEIKKVSNLAKDFSRVNMNIGVSYRSNLDQVIEVINRTGKALAEDPAFKDAIIKPIQFLRVDEFGDSAIIMKMVGDVQPLKQWEVAGAFRQRIKLAFEKEGIEIPFPQRVTHQAKE